MSLEIYPMELSDFQKIEPILYEKFDDFWTPNIFKGELENQNSYYFVAKNDDFIVGFAGISLCFDEATVTNIVIHKENRNLGIGSQLLEKLIQIAKQKNCTSITLEENEKNIAAIQLYKKFHFETVGLRNQYYNHTDNAIIMTKILPKQ